MKASSMYALSLDQTANAIKVGGHLRTILVKGHMGTGKSSLLNMLAAELPGHIPCYFDCTTKDLGDITIPNIAKMDDGSGYVTYLTNEELGVHLNQPIILMVDEFGKANPAVKNALMRPMLERKIGSQTLHPESIVFATTNLGSEGLGDMLMPQQRNRITPITARKPDNLEWIEWGLNNDIDHHLLGWCRDNPSLFNSFEDMRDPDENPYIYHPQATGRDAFVTPRSLEGASDWLKLRHNYDDQTLTAMLMGTIGERGAMDLMAQVKLGDQLPSQDSIKNTPETATVPTSASAVCMVVYRALASMERDWIDAWMIYMDRLHMEAQGLFANGVRSEKYSKRSLVMTNKRFTAWAIRSGFLFGDDKK